MKKDKLIAMLQEIEGNPDILLWNGMVGDWMDISKIVPTELVKITLPYYLKTCQLEDRIKRQDMSYETPPEEVASLSKHWRQLQWDVNEYVSSKDIKEGRYKVKNVMMIDAKPRGISTWDRAGTLSY